MAIEALEGKDTNASSRKGVFIHDITVEMFRNASLEGVEELMASGEMEDISLPPAQPERKTGTWIAVDYFADGKPAYREWECSACGCVVEDEKPTGNFCKMCGADMRGKQDDEQASTNND